MLLSELPKSIVFIYQSWVSETLNFHEVMKFESESDFVYLANMKSENNVSKEIRDGIQAGNRVDFSLVNLFQIRLVSGSITLVNIYIVVVRWVM